MKFYNAILEIARLLMILLFVYTGISKLIGYYLFYEQLTKIPLLQNIATPLSIAIPGIELVTAIALVVKKWEITGWWLSALLLSMFTLYIAVMMLFAPSLPCSCGGIISSLSWQQHLWINISLAMLCWSKLYRHYFILKFSMHTRE